MMIVLIELLTVSIEIRETPFSFQFTDKEGNNEANDSDTTGHWQTNDRTHI